MRNFLLIPASVVLTAAVGMIACSAAGREGHALAMTLAAGTIVLASFAGAVPVILARNATQLGVSQAALAGTMIHLFCAVALAAGAVFSHIGPDSAFLYWLMAFYWVTLITLVFVFARAIKSARVFSEPPRQ